MKLSSSLKEAVNTKNTSRSDNAKVKVESVTRRTGVRRRSQVWTTRVIPLEITKPVADDGEKNIWDATKEIEKNSCLKFRRKKSGDKNWIKIIKGEGCSSFVGRVNIKDGQPLSLGEGCNDKAVALHEILHAVGFYHEQSRTDRDDYINILWENIYEGAEGQFNKIGAEEMDMVGGTYDYNSIMHYGNNVFSKNDKPTMIAIKDPSKVLGTKGAKLNAVDILQINNLYNCKSKFHAVIAF
ncbi:Zinc metalloproteinase nas-13 [Exaiptasia diaphana]|nr:Zinc metalloproteinase nas-13 [Exaiptasia diaphana]